MINIQKKYDLITHYENGQIQERTFFRYGRIERERKTWYRNGQLKEHSSYRDGITNGKRLFWHDNGHLWIQSFHVAGNLAGESRLWNEKGDLCFRTFYTDGSGVDITLSNKIILLRLKNKLSRSMMSVLKDYVILDLFGIVIK